MEQINSKKSAVISSSVWLVLKNHIIDTLACNLKHYNTNELAYTTWLWLFMSSTAKKKD